uniref:WhiA-like protein n=2 Tax=root TaxID=1 RepID=A0A8S5MU09_9CAUD|nr:MAG TPA: WhiA-like protein [Myoviridae sp. ctino4]
MELAEMKQGEAGLGNSTIFDYTTGFARPQSVVGFDQARYDRRKHTYDHKMAQAAAVERWIQSIEDGQTRYVFKAFYQQGMTWEKIAEKTGYSQSPDYPRLYIRDTYLKKCEIK